MPNSTFMPILCRLALATALTIPVMTAGPANGAGVSAQGITFEANQAYPEGVAWDSAQQVFFVSSVRNGTIGKVTTAGEYTPFVDDDRLVSSVGLFFDAPRNLIWTAIGDLGLSERSTPDTVYKLAAVAAFDATTGEPRAYHDLSGLIDGPHVGNDVTVDLAGNVYVTDSALPVIYRVDPQGNASVFARSDLFGGEGLSLNGIVAHRDGFLLVGKTNSGDIFRVSTKDGQDIHRVDLPEAIQGADGLLLVDDTHLIVVQASGADQVVGLTSTDDWQTAAVGEVVKSINSFPTSATLSDDGVYVLNAQLDTLMNKDAPKVDTYLLQKY